MLARLSNMIETRVSGSALERALDELNVIVRHESESLRRHRMAVDERIRVARRARGISELVRNQFDLLPATAARLAADHQVRRRLWRRLGERLSQAS